MSRGNSPRSEVSLFNPNVGKGKWILDARVDWNDDIVNPPRLEILTDSIPDSLVYEKIDLDEGVLYYGELDRGYVRYYVHNPDNETGHSGRQFTFEMKDGSTERVTGPWSSRAGVVNALGLGPVVDIGITDDFDHFEEDVTLQVGTITLSAAKQAVDLVQEASHLERITQFNGDEPYWVPVHKDQRASDHRVTVSRRTAARAYRTMRSGLDQGLISEPPDHEALAELEEALD